MQTFSQVQPQIASTTPLSRNGISDGFIVLFLLAIPVTLIVGEILCRRHQFVQQKRQIETLERIWKLNCPDKTT
jgi:hypothetical protein